jgi:hypothetical protein
MQATNNQIELGQWWIKVYQYHQTVLVMDNALIYAEDSADIGEDRLNWAWSKWRRENRKAPMPLDLREMLNPEVDDRGAAGRLAQQLITAAERHGHYWTWHKDFQQQFVSQLGELAWLVVRERGGWSRFCGSLAASDNFETFKAQLRDDVAAMMEADRKGILNRRIELPTAAGAENKGLQPAGDILKLIGAEKSEDPK